MMIKNNYYNAFDTIKRYFDMKTVYSIDNNYSVYSPHQYLVEKLKNHIKNYNDKMFNNQLTEIITIIQSNDTFYNNSTCPPPCCIEVDASLTAMSTSTPPAKSLSTVFSENPPITNCCGTNFSECSQALKNVLGVSKSLVYQVNGIVEESTISGSTTLCIIATFLQNTTYTDTKTLT
jgi:hypothetical protein